MRQGQEGRGWAVVLVVSAPRLRLPAKRLRRGAPEHPPRRSSSPEQVAGERHLRDRRVGDGHARRNLDAVGPSGRGAVLVADKGAPGDVRVTKTPPTTPSRLRDQELVASLRSAPHQRPCPRSPLIIGRAAAGTVRVRSSVTREGGVVAEGHSRRYHLASVQPRRRSSRSSNRTPRASYVRAARASRVSNSSSRLAAVSAMSAS